MQTLPLQPAASHNSKAEYFWHYYTLPCPNTLRHKVKVSRKVALCKAIVIEDIPRKNRQRRFRVPGQLSTDNFIWKDARKVSLALAIKICRHVWSTGPVCASLADVFHHDSQGWRPRRNSPGSWGKVRQRQVGKQDHLAYIYLASLFHLKTKNVYNGFLEISWGQRHQQIIENKFETTNGSTFPHIS